MVAGAEDALQNEGHSQGVVEAKLFRDATIGGVKGISLLKLFGHRHHPIVLDAAPLHNEDKAEAGEDVAHVAEHVAVVLEPQPGV